MATQSLPPQPSTNPPSQSQSPPPPPPKDKDRDTKLSLTTHNQYSSPPLLRSHLDPNPLTQFRTWFSEALSPPSSSNIPPVREPEAVAISTVSPHGIPSTRMVLGKTIDDTGFVFFTNYTSRKSQEMESNGYASMAFYWKEVSRSVRVVGKVEKVDRKESEEYHGTRPRGSQLGAWASPQSRVVGEGEVGRLVKEVEERFEGEEKVGCPEYWGGWRLIPFEVEFWCGQPSRLHDRFRYTRAEPAKGEEWSTEWKIDRLAP